MSEMKHVFKIAACIIGGGGVALTSLEKVWNSIPGNCAGTACPDPTNKSLWLGALVAGVCIYTKGLYDIYNTKDYNAEQIRAEKSDVTKPPSP
ncbi:MAG: hypothetical protein MRY79_06500 [Alphaproteobacteria bacterium]|nr:hypothetical protein [Alphaproteobacteria bacterium]